MTPTNLDILVRSPLNMPDPNDPDIRHIFAWLDVSNVPDGMNLSVNVRSQNLNKGIYRQVENSLLNNDEDVVNRFHLGHQGMTFLTTDASVSGRGSHRTLSVRNRGKFNGLVNGGHTYKILQRAKEIINAENEEGDEIAQYVLFHVIQGAPRKLVNYIARAQNRSLQVTDLSLYNAEGALDDLKAKLRSCGMLQHVGFEQNSQAQYDARWVLQILEALDVARYPNDKDRYPYSAYGSPSVILKRYRRNPQIYAPTIHLLGDMLTLYETIAYEAPMAFRRPKRWKKEDYAFLKFAGGSVPLSFPVIGRESSERLHEGAALALVGAFRNYLVEGKGTKRFCWDGGFNGVLRVWQTMRKPLVKSVRDYFKKQKVSSGGKLEIYWKMLHDQVRLHKLSNP